MKCSCTFYNPPKEFYNKQTLKKHILEEHKDKILEFLSKINGHRLENIRNPESYAAGYLAAWMCRKESTEKEK